MTSMLTYIFVYGTLKTNEPNHHCFSEDKNGYYKFICNAQTSKKYPLIIATKYNIPFVLYSPGIGNYIKGEIYEIDDVVLAKLDTFEDHPNFYIREEDIVHNLDSPGSSVKAWIYFIKNFKQALLEMQMFDNYSNNGTHNLKYVVRYLREEHYKPKTEILM